MEIFAIDGAGNTFALLSFLNEQEAYSKNKPLLHSDAFIQSICRHAFDRPVDGVIILPPLTGEADTQAMDFRWEFFNSDGSRAEMCGNAARAISWWYYQNVAAKNQIHFLASEIPIDAEVLAPEKISVGLREVKSLGKASTGHYLYNSGVPHLVVFIPDNPEIYSEGEIHFEDSQSWMDLARKLRFPKELDDKGANVTLVWPTPERNKIGAITFERGVESWTMACGTGAMAAAYYAQELMEFEFPIEVRMPGGVLMVSQQDGSTILSGPAKVLQKKQIDLAEYL